ncbi:helix-turn-helix transcriptional regulator [Soonwooa sp.]|uniref:helix-turn-helix transcriptional regulator n=1 Tax=Soonwooa sp. TaxID=1938592 RepID=UPI0026285CE2|nr:helix-turn-helix transcriptional regulator [Soonwooa sp.]
MEINERISIIMEHYNITPSEFAEKVDVQRSSISHITSGRNKPSLEFITKVKSAFPDIEWDWLINNNGPMIKPKVEIIEEKPEAKKLPLPDLFSIIEDDNFGQENLEVPTPEKPNRPEPIVSAPIKEEKKTSNSQPLDNFPIPQGKTTKKVKRVILFFEDGTFEAFEN